MGESEHRWFTCDFCGGRFMSAGSEEDVEREFRERYSGEQIAEVDGRRVSACDDCDEVVAAFIGATRGIGDESYELKFLFNHWLQWESPMVMLRERLRGGDRAALMEEITQLEQRRVEG